MRDSMPKFDYGAYKPCGCLVGLAADMADAETAKEVAGFIRQGCYVERFPRTELDARLAKGIGCSCEKQQPTKKQLNLFDLKPEGA